MLGPINEAVDYLQKKRDENDRSLRKSFEEERIYKRNLSDKMKQFQNMNYLNMFQKAFRDERLTQPSQTEALDSYQSLLSSLDAQPPIFTPEFAPQKEPLSERKFKFEKELKQKQLEADKGYKQERLRILRNRRSSGGGRGEKYKGPYGDYFKKLDKLETSGLKILQTGYQDIDRKGSYDERIVAEYLKKVGDLRAAIREAIRTGKKAPDEVLQAVNRLNHFPAENVVIQKKQEELKAKQDALLQGLKALENAQKPPGGLWESIKGLF